jgi:hypothetical protein
MKRPPVLAAAGLCVALLSLPGLAEEPRGGCCPPPPGCPTAPVYPVPSTPVSPTPFVPEGTAAPETGAGTELAALPGRTGGAGIGAGAELDAPVFGDLIGIIGGRVVFLPAGVTPPAHVRIATISGNRTAVIAPLPFRSAFKITENESPRPTDRVFFNYNYYNNVDRIFQGIPGTNANLHRETIGFEKTFLNGDASFGMRLPFLQLDGSSSDFQDSHVDDLSMIFKYAFINNRETGNVLSAGLVLTAPTGEGLHIEGESTIHSTVFQPFLGFIYHFDRNLYLQGFSSLAAPSDGRDVTIFFNSLAAGYHVYRGDGPDTWVRSIVPVAEFHVNTPLNHRGSQQTPLGFDDSVDFTAGVYVQFRRAVLGIAVCTPLTGPKPYDVEAAANLNIHF